MPKTVFTSDEAEALKNMRTELEEAETDAAAEVAKEGRSVPSTDDKVAGILHRIQKVTGGES